MEIVKNVENGKLEIKLIGQLDTTTAPMLEKEVSVLDGLKDIVFDFSELEYISSAGLRVLLVVYKSKPADANMTIKNANDEVLEVFEITGLIDVFNIV